MAEGSIKSAPVGALPDLQRVDFTPSTRAWKLTSDQGQHMPKATPAYGYGYPAYYGPRAYYRPRHYYARPAYYAPRYYGWDRGYYRQRYNW